MPLAGLHLLPREIAQLGRSHWQNVELVKMVATALSESAGYVGAYHDNVDDAGVATSRDCGLMQINIPAREVGTDAESFLRTEDTAAEVALRVARVNVEAAYKLYEQPWAGRPIRRWQPWVAYTSGWALFPAWWTWHQVEGKPVGPWVPTGRYLQHAIAGVANYHLVVKKDASLVEAMEIASGYAERLGVVGDVIASHAHVAEPVVSWMVPRAPKVPPADGLGPRPIPNDGV